MKKQLWTPAQVEKLKKLISAGKSNREIATALGMPIENIHHKRSHMGLTMAKVAAVESVPDDLQKSASPVKAAPVKSVPTKSAPVKSSPVKSSVKPGPKKPTKKAPIDAAVAQIAEDMLEKASSDTVKTYLIDRSVTLTRKEICDALRRCGSPRQCDGCPMDHETDCFSLLCQFALLALGNNA